MTLSMRRCQSGNVNSRGSQVEVCVCCHVTHTLAELIQACIRCYVWAVICLVGVTNREVICRKRSKSRMNQVHVTLWPTFHQQLEKGFIFISLMYTP